MKPMLAFTLLPAVLAAATPKPVVLPGEPDYTADPAGQWAAAAEASSQYHDSGDYAAAQAAGAPNVPAYGGHANAWTTRTLAAGSEWLLLRYAQPVHATAVRVRQNYYPGAIVKVEVLDEAGNASTIWSGRDATRYETNRVGWFVATFAPTTAAVNAVRISLDTTGSTGWRNIDAVQLVGTAATATVVPTPAPSAPATNPPVVRPPDRGAIDALAARLLRPPGAASSGSPEANTAAFRFEPAAAPVAIAGVAARLGRTSAETRELEASLPALLAATLREFDGNSSPHDLAKAFAYLAIADHLVLHPEIAVDDALSERILAQFRAQRLDPAAARAADPATKQALFETLVLHGALALERFQKGTDGAARAAARKLAADGIKTFLRVDAAQLRIDPAARSPLIVGPAAAPAPAVAPTTVVSAAPPAPPAATAPAASGATGSWSGAAPRGVYMAHVFAPLSGSYAPSPRWLVLYDDGQSYAHLPQSGLATFDRARSRAAGDFNWGGWTWSDGAGSNVNASNPRATTTLKQDGRILLVDSDRYSKLAPVDGLRLEGAWTSYANPDDPLLLEQPLGKRPLVRFTRAGRFTDEGLFSGILFSPTGDGPPAGSGTYAIRDFTVTLRYDAGRVVTYALHGFLDRDPASDDAVLMIGRIELHKTKQ